MKNIKKIFSPKTLKKVAVGVALIAGTHGAVGNVVAGTLDDGFKSFQPIKQEQKFQPSPLVEVKRGQAKVCGITRSRTSRTMKKTGSFLSWDNDQLIKLIFHNQRAKLNNVSRAKLNNVSFEIPDDLSGSDKARMENYFFAKENHNKCSREAQRDAGIIRNNIKTAKDIFAGLKNDFEQSTELEKGVNISGYDPRFIKNPKVSAEFQHNVDALSKFIAKEGKSFLRNDVLKQFYENSDFFEEVDNGDNFISIEQMYNGDQKTKKDTSSDTQDYTSSRKQVSKKLKDAVEKGEFPSVNGRTLYSFAYDIGIDNESSDQDKANLLLIRLDKIGKIKEELTKQQDKLQSTQKEEAVRQDPSKNEDAKKIEEQRKEFEETYYDFILGHTTEDEFKKEVGVGK